MVRNAKKNGFLLATDEVNAGGVNDNKLQLIIENKQDKKEEALNVFKTTLASQNTPVTTMEAYTKDDVNFKTQLTKIKASQLVTSKAAGYPHKR